MNFNTKSGHWMILLLLSLIWGSSFILMKRGLEAFDDTQVAALRIFIAFVFLIPFAARHIKLMVGKKWLPLLVTGLAGNFIPAFLFTKAETGLSSSIVGMLNSLTPLFTLLLGVAIFRIKLKWYNLAGVSIGLCGAMGLVLADGTDFSGSAFFALLVVIATLLYALSVNVIKKYLQDIHSVQIAAVSIMFVGPVAGIYLFSTDFTWRLATDERALQSLGYIFILAVFGTALSIMIFNVLIKMTSAVFASMVTYVIPVFALMWGILDGENINKWHFVWILVIFAGVYLVNKKPKLMLERNSEETN